MEPDLDGQVSSVGSTGSEIEPRETIEHVKDIY